MATVSRGLPAHPHLDVPKREARELLRLWRASSPEAFERIRRRHPKYRLSDGASLASVRFLLSDAQLVVAREYGFSNWAELKRRISSNERAQALELAIRRCDREEVIRLLREDPALLHIPLRSGDWGPPMSHAANLGHIDLVQAVFALGARDLQHAFDRALLQGQIACARWLYGQGAQLAPGIIMGACETLNPDGLRFLAELNAPFTDRHGDGRAPLALVIETYSRNPEGKHSVLQIFAEQGYSLPDTPVVAFHRGDVARLEHHLRQDRGLVERRFASREIYPPELGCQNDGRSGMHGTPLDGTTLLHLAIDFGERAIFDLLLANGADVNARANIDSEGFGGHTPLFNALVSSANSCRSHRDPTMARALLDHGASPDLRANLRKFLDWQEEPAWHDARSVTPGEWARGFPHQNWVNQAALQLIENR